MWLASLALTGYGSFSDSGTLLFEPGVNLIVGENNSGKSGILQSLGPRLDDNRHKSSSEARAERLPAPKQVVDVVFSGDEFLTGFFRRGAGISWPTRREDDPPAQFAEYTSQSANRMLAQRAPNTGFGALNSPSHNMFEGMPDQHQNFEPVNGGVELRTRHGQPGDNLCIILDTLWAEKVFIFSAQRISSGRFNFGSPERLSSDASNLAAVLNKMQGTQPESFEALVLHLREIFSTVRHLSVIPVGENQVEIRVWPTDNRRDLSQSVSLDQSGTGIAQAIAILTVAMTQKSSIIVIDEIGSFLHPSAIKRLINILQSSYDEHQYIISSHSTEVISAAIPRSTYLVRKSGFESTIKKIDIENMNDLRELSAQLGVSMSDLFAADRIIWVEGPTEELCFPYIYRELSGPIPSGVLFTSVVATGDFSERRRGLTLELYRRLSASAAPLVKSVTFAFDREDLTSQDMDDLQRATAGRCAFLPRRLFECYLVDAYAIADLIVSSCTDLATDTVAEEVNQWLADHGGDAAYKASSSWRGDQSDVDWLTHVDAAKLIRDVVSAVSGKRLEFSKGAQSLELLKRILSRQPEAVAELKAYVDDLVARSAQ